MLSLPASIRIFVYTGVTDMRRSFDRLAQMVEEHLGQDPESGHLYLFFNREARYVKMAALGRGRVCDLVQALEAGTFAVPAVATNRDGTGTAAMSGGPGNVQILARDLNLLLAGADPVRFTRRKRFERAGM